MYIALYLFLFLSIVLKDENYEKYRDVYNSLLFGRGPNRAIEMACFYSKHSFILVTCVPRQKIGSTSHTERNKLLIDIGN